MTDVKRLIPVALLALSVLPAEAQSTRERLDSLELRVTQLQETLRGQALVELAQRLDALESEVRALRGDLDVLQRENEDRKKQQSDLAAEFDRRIAALEARLAAPVPAPTPAPSEAPVTTTVEPATEVVTPRPEAAAVNTPAVEPVKPAAAVAETPEVVYGRAFDALKASKYSEAIAGMSDFIARFGAHPLADNAQYWLGQTYFVTRDYPKAIEAFAAVGTRSPDSTKAPDALLKKGLSELGLGRTEAARASFNEVLRRYPQNEAARAAREQLARIR